MGRRFFTQLAVFFILLGILGGFAAHAMQKAAVIENDTAVLTNTSDEDTLYAISEDAAPADGELAVAVGGYVVVYPADELLAQVLASQMDSSYAIEAMKAQVVADYSTILYYNNMSLAPSVTLSQPESVHNEAVAAVSGQKICYRGEVVYAPSCVSTAGATNAAREMLGSIESYLVSVESVYDSEGSDWDVQTMISMTDLYNILSAVGLPVSMETAPEDWISILTKTDGGYVKSMAVCDATSCTINGVTETLTGSVFAELVNLPSAWFTVSVEGDAFVFTTRGSGDGVGLSRQGANLYAIHEGWSYVDILNHYYTDITIE